VERAVLAAEAALAAMPDADFANTLGLALVRAGRPGDALAALAQAAALRGYEAPEDAATRALAYLAQGETALARDALAEVAGLMDSAPRRFDAERVADDSDTRTLVAEASAALAGAPR